MRSFGSLSTIWYQCSLSLGKYMSFMISDHMLDISHETNSTFRFTARFLLRNIFLAPFDREQNQSFLKERVSPIRKTLFSRSLRLMPLALQVGVVEGLAIIMHESPALFPLTDQHLLAFLSELLKMLSVADGEMSDTTLSGSVVDKNGYVSVSKTEPHIAQHLSHSSALFFRRECVVDIYGRKVVVPEEMPVGIQLRVSAIGLLHGVIRGYSDAFFDAETSSPVGTLFPFPLTFPPSNAHFSYLRVSRLTLKCFRQHSPTCRESSFSVTRFQPVESSRLCPLSSS